MLEELYLHGNQKVNDELLEKAINKVREEVNPISDIRASDEYRRYVSGVLFKRAFETLIQENN